MQDVGKEKTYTRTIVDEIVDGSNTKMEIKNIQLIQKLLQSRLQKIWRVRQCGISLI